MKYGIVVGLVLLAGLAHAQAPDCTGTSEAFNSDPNYINELTTSLVASGLSAPVFITAPPGDLTRVFIVEQIGRIRIVKNGILQPTPFLDIQGPVLYGGEQGLLSMAFHPDYATNNWFFVYYTNSAGNQTIARFTAMTDDLANVASEALVIEVAHPVQGNHNGGQLQFGPDGHLYIGTGDGGGGCDPGPGTGNAQNLNNNLGKMLRLNVDQLPATTAGNPFDGATPGNDEIWAFGLRNPWRFSFDRETGALYIGDVGQNALEEVNCTEASSTGGENYGWVFYEGFSCPNPSCGSAGSCTLADYHPPILDYSLAGAPCAVTGGFVYRGCRMPDLRGTYFYSDACDDFVNTFRTNGSCALGATTNRENDLEPGGAATIASIVSFGEDAAGEMYIADLSGEVFKILPTLSIVEHSGANASPFVMTPTVWNFENFRATAGYQGLTYKVYRATSSGIGGPGPFTCVFSSTVARWVGGDPTAVPAGDVYFYLTAATNGTEETLPGQASDGTPRVVDTGSVCSL